MVKMDSADLARDLQRRCHHLVTELGAFYDYMASHKTEQMVEARLFKRDVHHELKLLEKLVRPSSP